MRIHHFFPHHFFDDFIQLAHATFLTECQPNQMLFCSNAFCMIHPKDEEEPVRGLSMITRTEFISIPWIMIPQWLLDISG